MKTNPTYLKWTLCETKKYGYTDEASVEIREGFIGYDVPVPKSGGRRLTAV